MDEKEPRYDGVEVKSDNRISFPERLAEIVKLMPAGADPEIITKILKLEDEFTAERNSQEPNVVTVIDSQEFYVWLVMRDKLSIDQQIIENVFDAETLFLNKSGLVIPPLTEEELAKLVLS